MSTPDRSASSTRLEPRRPDARPRDRRVAPASTAFQRTRGATAAASQVLRGARTDPASRPRRRATRRSAAGEVVGLAGLLGSGRSRTAKAIYGAQPLDGGSRRGRRTADARRVPCARAIAAGIALIPEDRKAEGIVPGLSVRDNITLGILPVAVALRLLSGRRPRTPSRTSSSRVCTSRHRAATRRSASCPAATSRRCSLARMLAMAPTAADPRRPDPRHRRGRQGRDPGARQRARGDGPGRRAHLLRPRGGRGGVRHARRAARRRGGRVAPGTAR